jgi:membrane protein
VSDHKLVPLLRETVRRWRAHSAPRLGAALAFYTLLSLAPLLLLVVAIVAFAFGQTGAEQRIVEQVRDLAGPQGARTVQDMFRNASQPSSGFIASITGIATLLFGASGVFGELRDALNTICNEKLTGQGGWKGMALHRVFSFGIVLGIGFLLLVSLVLSTAIATAAKFFSEMMPVPPPVLEIVNFAVSFATITCLFALIFKYVPDAKVDWHDTWVGATATSFLFTIGKVLLGLYLGVASVGSAYGAAGSLVAVIVWVYYSAQIFLFGAEFTFVYADEERAKRQTAAQSVPAVPMSKSRSTAG